ncbi:SIR2 family protein [Variovorax sp. efr-133-TYG-130]|uniref:SIR2 family protein n=1 Tax=Variovorax sp. efr-133-TYG-130 TaxID=3040327 RepID=UPI002555F391|nr:SIR2 family protein [Variovorax sp. efr-133-TYG-130]
MKFSREIEAFIKVFVKDLEENNVALFAGAGMSKSCGYVDWPELLRDIAAEIGLRVEMEHDLISLAQFHVNERGGSDGVSRKILEEFSEQAESSPSHEILARLPIRTYWTTNYDSLIEDSLKKAYKIADVKHSPDQLNHVTPKRDAVVYKMHGDVTFPKKAILYKQQYERYHHTHERFITALSGDLASKTFLFIGFSFSDPNLDYVLSRLHVGGEGGQKTHYSFLKKESPKRKGEKVDVAAYRTRKQELRVADLKRFGIQTLLIDDYPQIPQILEEIESRFRKKTVFISGSADAFEPWDRNDAQRFVHSLALELIRSNLRVVNGFGWGIGSAVINGALEAIYSNPGKHSEDQLVMRPFPQFTANPADLPILWEQYRHRMIGLAGVAIFVFGNKLDKDREIVEANGVIREFEIAVEHGLVPIPIGLTEYAARSIWNTIQAAPKKYYGDLPWLPPLIKELGEAKTPRTEIVAKVVRIISQLNK